MFTLGGDLFDSATTLVHASAAAYEDQPAGYAKWSELGFDRVSNFPLEEFKIDEQSGSTQGFVASNMDHLVISFRGTDDVFDLAVNAAASQNPDLEYYQGAVHQGFAGALDAIWMELRTLVDDLHLDGQTIWLTGHSLGGALATLTAKRLSHFMGPIRCITFGQPRVGDPAFATNFKVEHHRFVNERDVVPKLPPRGLFQRYWHVGQEELLGANGDYRRGEGDTSLLEDLFFGRLANMFDLSSMNNENFLDEFIRQGFDDHRIGTYVQRVSALPRVE